MHLKQKGKVTNSIKLRKKLWLSPTVEIEFKKKTGKIMIEKKLTKMHRLDRWVGILKNPCNTNRLIHKLRDTEG